MTCPFNTNIVSFKRKYCVLQTQMMSPLDLPCLSWTTADPYSNPYAFTLLLFAGASHHRSYCRCATHRSTFKLSAALPSRKAHFVLPEGRTHFFATRYVRWRHFPPLMPICILGHQRRPLCARYLGGVSLAGFPSLHLFATRYVRWRHFPPLMPILYSRTSEETTLRPLFGRGFIGGFSFPPLFATRYVRWRHMTLRRETTTTGLESFPSLCARYMGGVFYPGFPSCGRRAGS